VENLKDQAKAYLAAPRGAKTKARRDNIIEETPSRPPLPRPERLTLMKAIQAQIFLNVIER
jgi:hypothetical protein